MIGGVEKEEIIDTNKIFNVGVLKKLCNEKEDIQNEFLAALFLYYQTGAIDKSLVVGQLETERPVKDTKDKVLKLIAESKIRVDPNANLIDIPMKQHFKLVKQFGDTKLLNPNEGQCVIDFLESRYRSGKNSMKKALKDSNLKKIFGNNYRVEGITINQLATFCEENQIDIYAFNDFNRLIYQKTYEKSHKQLLFHIKNNHLLPIVETSLIKCFVQTGRSQMFDYKFSIVYDDFLYFSEESQQTLMETIKNQMREMKIDEQKSKFDAKVILIDDQSYDINLICHNTQILSEYQITDFKFDKDNHLLAFRIPGTNLVIESVYDFKKRREEFLHLKELFPNYFSQFYNQSYTEIGIQMFEMFNSMNKLRSNMSEKLFEFYQSYSRGPYIATIGIDQKIIQKCQDKIGQVGLEINKSYTNVILNSGYDYNKYFVFDKILQDRECWKPHMLQ